MKAALQRDNTRQLMSLHRQYVNDRFIVGMNEAMMNLRLRYTVIVYEVTKDMKTLLGHHTKWVDETMQAYHDQLDAQLQQYIQYKYKDLFYEEGSR